MEIHPPEPTHDKRDPTGPSLQAALDRIDSPDAGLEDRLARILACFCPAPADQAVLLLLDRTPAASGSAVLAAHPDLQTIRRDWLDQAAALAIRCAADGQILRQPLVNKNDLYGLPANRTLVAVPVRGPGDPPTVAVLAVDSAGPDNPAVDDQPLADQRLAALAPALRLCQTQDELRQKRSSLDRLHGAAQILSSVLARDRFDAAAMAFCNQLAAAFDALRVSLGVRSGRYVRLAATNHAERIDPQMGSVREIEAAMDESLDQDLEIVHPCPPESVCISRCAAQLSARRGPSAVATLPFRKAGLGDAAVTLERPADRPFTEQELQSLRLACQLCFPALLRLHQTDRWFGAWAAARIARAVRTFPEPRHAGAKLAAVLLAAAAVFLVFAHGDYTIKSPFSVQAKLKRSIPAPFRGLLKSALVEPGAKAQAGQTVLAVMDTAELTSQLSAARADRANALKQIDIAVEKGDIPQSQQARAQADEAEAKIQLLRQKIDQATIVSPISGTVLSGNLKPRQGAPVESGEVLFEVAPLDCLEAEILVEEGQIADIRPPQSGNPQTGELVTVAFPQQKIDFVVESVCPVSELVEKKNVFKIRARLIDPPDWLRPGMEGVAWIHAGDRPYTWLWTHRFFDWVRLKLWQ